MKDKHNLELLNKIIRWKHPSSGNEYILYRFYTNERLQKILTDNKRINEEKKASIKDIYKQIISKYFYFWNYPKRFKTPEDLSRAFLECLHKYDPNGIMLDVLNEKYCGAFYEQFADDHQKWLKLTKNYVLDYNWIEKGDSLAQLATESITDTCGIQFFPLYKFKKAIEAEGFEVDEQRVIDIIKNNKLKTSHTLMKETINEISETNIKTSEGFTAVNQKTLSQQGTDLDNNELIETSFDISTHLTEQQSTEPKKASYSDSFEIQVFHQ